MYEIKIKITLENGKEVVSTLSVTDEHLDKISASAKDAGKNLDTGFGKIGGILTEINQGLELAKKGFSLISIPVNLAADLEQARVSFEVMLGSVEAADDAIAKLKQKAAATPFEFTDLQDAAKTMLNFGISIEDTYPLLDQLGDVSAGNAQRLQQLALVMGQVASAGKLQGQDLLQLINAGYNPLQEISRTTGQSMADLRKEMEKGLITYDMVKESLKTVTGEGGRFNGMMEKQSQTFTGLVSTMMDGINNALGAFGTKLLPAGKNFVKEITNITDVLTAQTNQQEIVTQKANEQAIAFDVLSNKYLMLKGKVALNRDEHKILNETIAELQTRYPEYLKGIDLSTASFDSAHNAIKAAKIQLDEYLESQIRFATLQDSNNLIAQKTAEKLKLNAELATAQAHLTTMESDENPDWSKRRVIDADKKVIQNKKEEIEKLTTEINYATKEQIRLTAEVDKYFKKTTETVPEVTKSAETTKEVTKQTESYWKVLTDATNAKIALNKAILSGADEAEIDGLKKSSEALDKKLKAYDELIKLQNSTPRAPQTVTSERESINIPAGKTRDFAVVSRDTRGEQVDSISSAQIRAENTIMWERLTTEEKIKAIEQKLSAELLSADEQKRLEEDLFNYKMDLYVKEKTERLAMIQEVQGMWHQMYQDMAQSGLNFTEASERMFERFRDKIIMEIGDIVIAHAIGEETMTATTEAGVTARIASGLVEKSALIVQKLAVITATLWESYLNFFSWAGPFAVPLAAAGIVGSIGVVKGAINAVGMDQGGEFTKDQPGFFEGRRMEVVAPKRTFERVMSEDLIPRVLANSFAYQMNAKSMFDENRLANKIGKVISENPPEISVDQVRLDRQNQQSSKFRSRLRS